MKLVEAQLDETKLDEVDLHKAQLVEAKKNEVRMFLTRRTKSGDSVGWKWAALRDATTKYSLKVSKFESTDKWETFVNMALMAWNRRCLERQIRWRTYDALISRTSSLSSSSSSSMSLTYPSSS